MFAFFFTFYTFLANEKNSTCWFWSPLVTEFRAKKYLIGLQYPIKLRKKSFHLIIFRYFTCVAVCIPCFIFYARNAHIPHTWRICAPRVQYLDQLIYRNTTCTVFGPFYVLPAQTLESTVKTHYVFNLKDILRQYSTVFVQSCTVLHHWFYLCSIVCVSVGLFSWNIANTKTRNNVCCFWGWAPGFRRWALVNNDGG